MTAAPGRQRPRFPEWALVAFITLLAAALRLYRLGAWSFDSDETFTLRDSLHPTLTNPRPLFYFLNHYLVLPFHPLDELGLRLLPSVFGILAIPALYLVTRRLAGPRAALFTVLFLAVSPLHVFYSQFGRYWTLVFLLSAVYPYVLYLGILHRNRAVFALGAAVMLVDLISHPVSVLVETFGTSSVDPERIGAAVQQIFDLRPAAIIRDLDLRRPIYKKTAAYGHFGRSDKELTWEQTTRVDDLKSALGL